MNSSKTIIVTTNLRTSVKIEIYLLKTVISHLFTLQYGPLLIYDLTHRGYF